MKSFKRILGLIGILVIILVAGGLIYLSRLKTRALPDYDGSFRIQGLENEVTVYRDSLGIPHIYAKNEADLYRVTGFVMAQDRLWQMDLLRRICSGRLSEVLDPGLVDADQLFRALNFSAKSAQVLAKTDPEIISCIEAFSDGINQYINQQGKKLPFEFALLGYTPEPWTPLHTVNLISYMAWDLSSGWNTDMALYRIAQVVPDSLFRELLPDFGNQLPVFPGFRAGEQVPEMVSRVDAALEAVDQLGLQVFEASNNWAVSGKKSKTGKPLMSNDMHLGLMSPGIWYQMHQVIEGKVNATGVGLPGAPFVVAGHNEDIGWGMTNVTVDDLDFYLETLNPADSNQYLTDGVWRDMRIIEEKINVKGQDEPEIRINRYTHRGPVVSSFRDIDEQVISAAWQGNAFSNELRTVYLLNRAKNWEDFRDAVRTFNSVSQNIVYADRYGNIGLQTSAGVPIRHSGGVLVYPGDTSLYDWQGTVAFEELPFEYNPERGYVSSANNKTVDENYPYYIGSWYSMPYRIGRIREMLEEKERLGIEDFKSMLRDQHSHLARKMTPIYLEALGEPMSKYENEALAVLKDWGFEMHADSAAPLIFEIMWLELNHVLFRDELDEKHFPLLANGIVAANLVDRITRVGGSAWCDDVNTPEKEDFNDNIRLAFSRTVDTLCKMYGKEVAAWKWGDLHKISLQHPLGSSAVVDKLFKVNRGPYPIGGASHTVCPYSYPKGKSFVANHGASERHLFNTADWDASLTVIPTGISGIPASKHYLDQTPLYLNNQFHRDHFSRTAVEENMKYKAVFTSPK